MLPPPIPNPTSVLRTVRETGPVATALINPNSNVHATCNHSVNVSIYDREPRSASKFVDQTCGLPHTAAGLSAPIREQSPGVASAKHSSEGHSSDGACGESAEVPLLLK